jgi:hypothetical protein
VNALDEQLGRAFDDEPPVGDAIEAVFVRAERLRQRRIRRLLLTGLTAVVLVAAAGYGLTSVLLPSAASPAVAPAAPPATAGAPVTADDLAPVLAAISGLDVQPRDPAAGPGWRHYSAFDAAGHARGLIEISVYWQSGGVCLPVLGDPNACALPQHVTGLEYARYTWDTDVNWQINEVIARRLTDGRTIAVQATGRRNSDDAESGRPPLTGRQAADVATDPRVLAAFGPAESCNDPAVTCPDLRAKVRAAA